MDISKASCSFPVRRSSYAEPRSTPSNKYARCKLSAKRRCRHNFTRSISIRRHGGLASETARKNLAGTVLRELVAKPIWSTRPQAIFHADPYAGNIIPKRRFIAKTIACLLPLLLPSMVHHDLG